MAELKARSPRERTGGFEENMPERDDDQATHAAGSCQQNADDYEAVPQRMRDAKRWIVWKSEPNRDPAKKPRKVPFYCDGTPRRGQLDTEADRERMGSFDAALRALERGSYAGLGFALGPDGTDNCWQGVDIDYPALNCEPHVVTDDLPSYTETSPSGQGLHAVGYGPEFPTLGANGSGIEAYAKGRFFTVTGEGAGIGEICDLTAHVHGPLRKFHSARGEAAAQAAAVEAVTDEQRGDLRSALAYLDADDRDTWVSICHALKPLGNVGRGLWVEWSQASEKYDSTDAARVWSSAKPDRTGYEAVFAKAQAAGWLNPRKGGSNRREAPTSDTPIPDWPCVDLSQYDEQAVTDWPCVIESIAPRRVTTLLSGHGGAGKSMLGLILAAHVASGRGWGPLAIEPGRAVFVSLEDEAAVVTARLRRITEVYGLPVDEVKRNLNILDGSGDVADMAVEGERGALVLTPLFEHFAQRVAGADLVLLDNASDAYGANENERRQVRAFVRALARIARHNNGAVLLLAHVDKVSARGGGMGQNFSGSTAWHNSARSRLALIESGDAGIELLHEKANYTAKIDPVALRRGFAGVLEPVPAAVAEAARAEATAIREREDSEAVLNVMRAAIDGGQTITTAEAGPLTTWRALCQLPELPDAYRNRAGRKRLEAAMVALERGGHIAREEFVKTNRHKGQRWVLAQSALGRAA